MTKYHLTIGYIPKDCDSEFISCGDPENSGTKEVNLIWEDDIIKCSNSDSVINVNSDDIWKIDSDLWSELASKFTTELSSIKRINPTKIATSWAIFQDENPDDFLAIEIVSDDESGEFSNDNLRYNGHFYIRYQLEEDDEFFGEKVVVFS